MPQEAQAQLVMLRPPAGPKGRAKMQYKDGDLLILAYAPAEFAGRAVTLRFPAIPAPAAEVRETTVPAGTDLPRDVKDALALVAKWQQAARRTTGRKEE
jgi:hypothetical protein